MTGRKVVQISTATDESTFHKSVMCTVLCDDGRMYFIRSGDTEWKRLPPIPQDAEPAPAAVRAGPVTEEEVKRVSCSIDHAIDYKYSRRAATKDALTEFLTRRGISTEPTLTQEVSGGPVTTDEVHMAVAKWERTKPPTIGQGLYDAFVDFIAGRGISDKPVEYADEQVERMCQVFEAALLQHSLQSLREVGRTLRTYLHTAMDAMRAALAKLP